MSDTDHKSAAQLLQELQIKNWAIESSINAIAFSDLDGILSYVNPAFLKLWRYSAAAEVLGRPVVEFWSMAEEVKKVIDELGVSGGWIGELEAKAGDGRPFPVQVSASMIKDVGGKPVCMMASLVDVTERRNTEDALRDSEERFSKAFRTSPYSYMIASMEDGAILEVNDAFTVISGFTREEALASSTLKLNFWVDQEARKLMVATLRENGVIERLETRLRAKNGKIVTALVSARAIRLGNRPCIISIMEDITYRKNTEESLLASEQKYRDLANNVPVGIFEIGGTGKLTFANKTLFEWFGYSEAEFAAGINVADLVVPEDRQRIRENMADVLSIQSAPPREYCVVRKNGEKIQVIALTTPIMVQGQLQGIRGILLDLTEKKKMESAIQNAAKLDSLGVLAGGIAHDFNNLLAGIYGYIDLSRLMATDAQVKEYLGMTLTTMDRAKALTRQLLTFSKGGSPVPKITSIPSFIRETVTFALSGSNISCRFSLAENLQPCIIDKNQISQVFDNIVINALQAMPSGGAIEITAVNSSFEENEHPPLVKGNYVKVSIKDFGIGIPTDILPHIFEPYYTTKLKGHGLGLATCYSIINRHGGCIDVESEPGTGSTFHVYLPASSDCSAENVATIGVHKGSGTIIVMDDEPVVRTTFRKMLELLGYSVVEKADGKEAVDFFTSETTAQRRIAAMIFDLTVPGGMGGLEAVKQIRKLDKEIPVFVSSGYADTTTMTNPVEQGFTASISKPFTLAELSEILNRYLKL